jgi:hypothetical protein
MYLFIIGRSPKVIIATLTGQFWKLFLPGRSWPPATSSNCMTPAQDHKQMTNGVFIPPYTPIPSPVHQYSPVPQYPPTSHPPIPWPSPSQRCCSVVFSILREWHSWICWICISTFCFIVVNSLSNYINIWRQLRHSLRGTSGFEVITTRELLEPPQINLLGEFSRGGLELSDPLK